MRTSRTLIAGVLVFATALSPRVFAQERHVVDRAALADAVAQQVDKQEADRTAIREALARPEVRELAGKVGVDLDRVGASLGTLTGADLERAAQAARQVNERLVGGQRNLVISTTTLIIILLVVILIIVAVD
jgi:hypothetical protein